MASKQETLRSRVYNFYSENINAGKLYTVHHFQAEGVPKATVYRILKRFQVNLPASRQSGSGGSNRKMTTRKKAALKRAMDNKDGISQRQAAQRFQCSQPTINRTLKKLGIKARKKQRIPQRTEKQQSDAKKLCGRLYRKFSKAAWIIDDESYFTLSHSTVNGNNIFYTSDIKNTPPSAKFSSKTKFEKKVLVWLAIGPNGWSDPLIKESNFAINGTVYLEECIKKRLIPYIRSN
jgi:transposase